MDAAQIGANLARIRERIAAACTRARRSPDEVTLVAVSKTQPAEAIRAAYELGVRHFGENRVQEWEDKAPRLADLRDATWHLVGHLQSNKARRAVELFHAIDSVDSIALARRLDRIAAEAGDVGADPRVRPSSEGPSPVGANPSASLRASAGAPLLHATLPTAPVLIEVRLAPEETKAGVMPEDVPALAEAILALPRLRLRGLMCIPPFCENPEEARPYFRRLRELRDGLLVPLSRASAGADPRVRPEYTTASSEASAHPSASLRAGMGAPLHSLSMGMSHDFEVAIEEGATEIRIGTALFGPR